MRDSHIFVTDAPMLSCLILMEFDRKVSVGINVRKLFLRNSVLICIFRKTIYVQIYIYIYVHTYFIFFCQLGMIHNWTEFLVEVVCCKYKLGKFKTKDIITNNSSDATPISLKDSTSSSLPNVNLLPSPSS